MTLIEELGGRRNSDGGWPAAPGGESNTECTALAAMALAGGPGSAGARRWLVDRQHASGAWPFARETPPASWPTPVALLVLEGATAAGERAALDRGFDWLVRSRGKEYGWLMRLWHRFIGRRRIEMDVSLVGWPWVPGTASWVEPTGWSLLALKTHWPADPPAPVRDRVREAEAMLLDRSCYGGGWNYGNKRVFDEELEPYPDTTAVALLGLRGAPSDAVDAGFAALDRLLRDHASTLSLALATLARRSWGRDARPLLDRLERQTGAAVTHDTRSLALAALAAAPLPWPGAA